MKTILWSGGESFITLEDGVVAILVRDQEYTKLLNGTLSPADLPMTQSKDDVTVQMQSYTTDAWVSLAPRVVSKLRLLPRDLQFD